MYSTKKHTGIKFNLIELSYYKATQPIISYYCWEFLLHVSSVEKLHDQVCSCDLGRQHNFIMQTWFLLWPWGTNPLSFFGVKPGFKVGKKIPITQLACLLLQAKALRKWTVLRVLNLQAAKQNPCRIYTKNNLCAVRVLCTREGRNKRGKSTKKQKEKAKWKIDPDCMWFQPCIFQLPEQEQSLRSVWLVIA